MYNRYIPNGAAYTRIPMEDPLEPKPRREQTPPGASNPEPNGAPPPPGSGRTGDSFASFAGILSGEGLGGLNRLLRSLKLDDLDSGDILLLLIVLLLLLEGDNLELAIALGLVLIMGLGDE